MSIYMHFTSFHVLYTFCRFSHSQLLQLMATLSKNIQLYSSFYNQDLLHIILYEKPVTWNYDLLLFT